MAGYLLCFIVTLDSFPGLYTPRCRGQGAYEESLTCLIEFVRGDDEEWEGWMATLLVSPRFG